MLSKKRVVLLLHSTAGTLLTHPNAPMLCCAVPAGPVGCQCHAWSGVLHRHRGPPVGWTVLQRGRARPDMPAMNTRCQLCSQAGSSSVLGGLAEAVTGSRSCKQGLHTMRPLLSWCRGFTQDKRLLLKQAEAPSHQGFQWLNRAD